jgi:aspartyl protease family protein
MIRLAASSVAVVGLAMAASLSAAFWLNRLGGPGEAQAAPAAVAVSASTAPATGSAAQVTKGADGHYWADARIEGRAVRVMIDTGATVVALTLDDARRLGVTPNEADFTRTVQTASGPVPAAPVRLKTVSVGRTEVRDVEALVLQDGLPHSLLGMSYLGRLSAFEATPAGLTLRP